MSYVLNIPPIEDDELMSSYFIRMATANGFKNPVLFMQSYIWPNSIIAVKQNRTIRDDGFNMLVNYDRCFGENTSIIDFFMRTSLFPGIRPVMSNVDTIVLYVFRDNTNDIEIIPKRFAQDVKYCPICVQNDIKNKGFFWARRSHNMPGVNTCYKHHCLLNEAKNGQMTNKDSVPAETIEINYAEFAHAMLISAIDCTNLQTIDAIKTKITELGYSIPTGGYADYCADVLKNDLKGFLPENIEYILRAGKKSIVNSASCEAMLKILFMLFQSPDVFQQYIHHRELFSFNNYSILEYNAGLLKLQHKCGNTFVTTQELFNKGWQCPCCKSVDREKNISNHITSACQDQYKIIGISGAIATLQHKKCGQHHNYRISEFILDDTRCNCERRKDLAKVKHDVESIKGFKLIKFQGVNHPMKIRHQICKAEFDVDYYNFMSAPYCRACLQNKLGVDIKITPRTAGRSSEASFIHELSELVGDEYTFIGPYNGDQEYTYIRHNKCGTVERYMPSHFRQGIRCKQCAVKTSYEGFTQYVHDLTNGEYEIVNRGKKSYLIIKNTQSGDEYSLLKPVIIQELNRAQPSRILPLQHKAPINIEKYALKEKQKPKIANYALVYNTDTTWNYIQDHFAKTDLFSSEDIDMDNTGLWVLARNGKIKRVMTALYTFPENDVKAIDIIKYKYYEKFGKRFGYWFGQSFAYQLGLIDKPKTVFITSNKMTVSERSNFMVSGQPVVLRKPIAEITNDNYKILAVIDYLTTYKNGFRGLKHVDKAHEVTALRHFIGSITRKQFTVYADQCTDKEKLETWLDLIYEDGLFARIQNEFRANEVFHPDDVNATDTEMAELVEAGKLKKVYKRLYTFPNNDVTINNIIEYKYLKRHNTILGYWYGESFMHYLGVYEKPDRLSITSSSFSGNSYHYRESEEKCIEGYKIHLRKPLVKLTDENYKILCIVDFLSEYGIGYMNNLYFYPYKHIDLNALLPALKNYLSGIDQSAFDKYMNLVKNADTFKICLDLIYTHSEIEEKISNMKKNTIFDAETIGYSDKLLWAYVRTGKIKNVYEGLFARADADITDDTIIDYQYRIHNDVKIGYWFGRSFTYSLGLIEKPDEYSIVTDSTIYSRNTRNTKGKRRRSEQSINGHKIILRNPITPITEDNIKILCVIDYTTTYRRAFYYSEHIDKEIDAKALQKYLQGIPRKAFKQYEDLCESKKLLNEWLDRIYGVT
ncbi:MAG: TniQ family protein [Lachnospiraceae bacterium]|nr:TniQ family protein [Lachnospiraceae bacterium]